MSESANSSSVSLTPTFLASKYTSPTWEVRVNDVIIVDAILEKVDIGYGSDLSTAVFALPRSPFSPGNPHEGDGIKIYVNTKKIFDGVIKVKTDHLGNDGQKITYTAIVSHLSDLNKQSIKRGSFPNSTTKSILSQLGVSTIAGVPQLRPGEINVTDQTNLSAIETILARIGNYKLYYDVEKNTLSIYALGTGGLNTRSFIAGKNIINYDITKSSENIVDSITVTGPPAEVTTTRPVSPRQEALSPSGRMELFFTLNGTNIRNIRIVGQVREQPKIEFSKEIFINRAMFKNTPTTPASPPFNARTENFLAKDEVAKESREELALKPVIIGQTQYETTWADIPVSLKYRGNNTVDVYISEVPKMWYAYTAQGTVPNTSIGKNEDGDTQVEILNEFLYTVGPMRASYVHDGDSPSVTVGSGRVGRSINDGQYAIREGSNPRILENMHTRAQAEFDRLHVSQISGTITVLGDETIDLRTTIDIDSELLDILHITHNFINGFTTDVTVTNEQLASRRSLIIGHSSTKTSIAESEKEKRKTLRIDNLNTDLLRKQNQQADSSKKKPNAPPSTGPYSVYR